MTELFSDIPLWMLIFLAVVSSALGWLLYRKKSWVKDISNLRRFILIGLRSLGLFLLGMLLFGILIKGVDKEIDQPIIITIIDDSQSMLNYSDSLLVEEQTNAYLKAVEEQLDKKFNSLTFTLDSQLRHIDSLVFNNSKTNLSSVLNKVYDNYYGRNIGAIVMLTDGNFNTGTNPSMVAEKFKRTPIYTLSVGDTIQKVDHLIKSIVANEIAFLNNKFPVEITIEGNKTPKQPFEVKLLKDGKLIASQKLVHQDSDYSLIKKQFTLEATAVGMHEYTVQIEKLANEFNLKNNTQSFYIEVLDDRSKVLLLHEALNPDVGAVSSALTSENNLEIVNKSINELPEDLTEFDLIIWFDPGVSGNTTAFKTLLNAEKPTWYFISPQTSRTDISLLKLPANIRITGQMDNIGAAFNQSFNLFKLSPEARKSIDQFPPLNVHYGELKYDNLGSVLAFQKVGTIAKKDPLLFFANQQDKKLAVTYGVGLWSWRIADYQMNQSHDNFNEIVRKTVQYLIVKENTSRLRINLPSIASSDVDFVLQASFYNESYEPITEPTIKLELSKPNGESFEYTFLPLENEYSLNLGKLPAGRYNWKAQTTYNGKQFQKEGGFAIKDLELEKQSTKANHQLLLQIAANSNGEFRMLSEYQDILDQIINSEDIVPVAYESSTFHKLIDYWGLLLIIVLLFTGEWIIRRYSGAY